MEIVSRVVRQLGVDWAFASRPRLRKKRPCCRNVDSNSLWSGLVRKLSSGAEGSQRRPVYRINLYSA